MRWNHDISLADLQALAQRLEAFAAGLNAKAMAIAGVASGEVVTAFANEQAKLLRFDHFDRRQLIEAIEEARVQTLAQDNVFLACVMSAALALKHFQQRPRSVEGRWGTQVAYLQKRSTGLPALWLLSVASIYGVLGRGAVKRISAWRKRPRVLKL